jgi:hypothetical protein
MSSSVTRAGAIVYVNTLSQGESFGAGRVTPPLLVDMLRRDNREALRRVESIDTTKSASLMYEVADVKTWANLGLHLAEKLEGADNGNSHDANPNNLFHWALIRDQVAADVEVARSSP